MSESGSNRKVATEVLWYQMSRRIEEGERGHEKSEAIEEGCAPLEDKKLFPATHIERVRRRVPGKALLSESGRVERIVGVEDESLIVLSAVFVEEVLREEGEVAGFPDVSRAGRRPGGKRNERGEGMRSMSAPRLPMLEAGARGRSALTTWSRKECNKVRLLRTGRPEC